MPSYEYLDTVTGKTHQVEQRISDSRFTHYSQAQDAWLVISDAAARKFIEKLHPVKRLISGAPAVQFISGPSGGWSDSGYALTPAQRKAEAKLGRRVTRRA